MAFGKSCREREQEDGIKTEGFFCPTAAVQGGELPGELPRQGAGGRGDAGGWPQGRGWQWGRGQRLGWQEQAAGVEAAHRAALVVQW